MGTRSLTKVIETYKDKENKEYKTNLICMYRQYDGYPSGHGQELCDFLFDRKIVNGYNMEHQRGKYNNGMGCLGAELIQHFKDGVGNIYLYSPDTQDVWEDYTYLIEGNEKDQLKVKVMDCENKKIFEGSPSELQTYINEL
tara:strand:+ start:5970 stop:6392 length:423 start_codon:yes stop_codon:yes gene_type:complete